MSTHEIPDEALTALLFGLEPFPFEVQVSVLKLVCFWEPGLVLRQPISDWCRVYSSKIVQTLMVKETP